MEIRKRNGESVPFQQEKIFNAMKKAFDGQGKEIGSREMDEILATVLNNLSVTVPLTVERVQDEVERTLMERGHYEVAKAYILYREKRSALRRVRHTIARTVGDDSLDELLRRFQMDFTEEVYSLAALQMKFESFCRPGMTEDERAEALTKAAVELTTAEAPKWEFIAARLLNHSSYYKVVVIRVPLQGQNATIDKVLWIGLNLLPQDGLRKAPTTALCF